jgi:hypothetical protein
MHKAFRRVVTGHDANGIAIIESDQTATQLLERPNRPGVRLTNFWLSHSTPAEYDGPVETCEGPFILHAPANGSVFHCVEFMPENPEVMAKLDCKAAFAEMGACPLCQGSCPLLYFSGGRDRTMTWDIHRNEKRLC